MRSEDGKREQEAGSANATEDAVAPRTSAQTPVRQSAPDVPLGGSPFPPIADYGFLSDCETVALVAPSGNVEWLCLPRVDSPSVFGAMLDRDAGAFRIGPSASRFPPRGGTCPARWCSRPAGPRAPAG